jgi:hypothetical protein
LIALAAIAKLRHFFDSGPNFLDPQISKEGKPYGPKRYKEIVKECWYISDQLHTSYTDVLDLSFQERLYLIECINDKQVATQKAVEQLKAQYKTK